MTSPTRRCYHLNISKPQKISALSSELRSPDALYSERTDMATDERGERNAGNTPAATAEPDSSDPRDTDHPTGSKQAAENVANDPPS